MNPGESKTDYVKRCIVQEEQNVDHFKILGFPQICLKDELGDCFFATECSEDEAECVLLDDCAKSVDTVGDWSLVDTCNKNTPIGGFSDLDTYIDGLAKPIVASTRRSRRH